MNAPDIAFLDRDGTINVRRVGGYVDDPADVELLPGAAAAIARLNAAGARVVVMTNQRGLATGRLEWAAYDRVTERLVDLLGAEGAHLDAIRVCPHDHNQCVCRKPADGMFRDELAAQPWARPERCVMVGDMPSDVAPARGLGMTAYELGVDVPDLAAAVDQILAGQ